MRVVSAPQDRRAKAFVLWRACKIPRTQFHAARATLPRYRINAQSPLCIVLRLDQLIKSLESQRLCSLALVSLCFVLDYLAKIKNCWILRKFNDVVWIIQ